MVRYLQRKIDCADWTTEIARRWDDRVGDEQASDDPGDGQRVRGTIAVAILLGGYLAFSKRLSGSSSLPSH